MFMFAPTSNKFLMQKNYLNYLISNSVLSETESAWDSPRDVSLSHEGAQLQVLGIRVIGGNGLVSAWEGIEVIFDVLQVYM